MPKELSTMQRVGQAISESLKILLSEKHLYQSVKVDFSCLDSIASENHRRAQAIASRPLMGGGGARGSAPPLSKFQAELNQYPQCGWFPSNAAALAGVATEIFHLNNQDAQKYLLPTIKTTCNHCDERGPFNPVGAFVENSKLVMTDQWLSVSYQCQNCKKEPMRFLIRRNNDKFTLCGRDPFETIGLPSFIPKQHSSNFRNAIIANHAGQTLAGIFLMRVFVEQFWKSVPEVAEAMINTLRPTGDELGEAYKATLSTSFKDRFPTLCEVYSSLSEAMHSGRPDAEIFSTCHDQIIEHFDARRLFKMVMPSIE
ncbi:hypothetical protein JIN84_01075 [Luteolibacter yonseiensis]|uniref:Uncharacterized protein n=1 Tax=Luteolibacter yonseiensis TaxID=1144680 RepID=A0A934R296_9BACT|nr:hypothetical protein [Luteolibacter yonseiensis]MBK1814200.1 hypothetical protein [Luteolibacter yonseiensis]